jgi:hypothetical protein
MNGIYFAVPNVAREGALPLYHFIQHDNGDIEIGAKRTVTQVKPRIRMDDVLA